ncbi:MAG: hypothetical protein FJY88_09405, partial [Candidatus Eisenbacteria bacterium]|nr:hypothetical protein [Candidatus Eisenbacteria bacterium]
KGLDPALFADQIGAYKLTPSSWSLPLAYLFVAVEAVIGLGLLLRIRPGMTHLAFIALMLGFIGATAIAWISGNTKECGCFGRVANRGPGNVIVEDSLLIGVSAAAALLLRGARTPRPSILIGAILLPIAIVFTALGSRLPADGFVTGIRAGASLEDLPVEDLPGSLMEGWQLLALVKEDCPPCKEAIPRLNGLARDRKDIRITAVFSGSRQQASAWRLENLPAFRVAYASPRGLRAYYRSLPSCFLIREGRVVEAWWGRIPEAAEVERLLPGD